MNRYIGRALELFPGQVDFHLSKGHTLNYSKQYPQAIKAYKQSLGYAPDRFAAQRDLGFIGDTWQKPPPANRTSTTISPRLSEKVRSGRI